jgi:hypothetical protein
MTPALSNAVVAALCGSVLAIAACSGSHQSNARADGGDAGPTDSGAGLDAGPDAGPAGDGGPDGGPDAGPAPDGGLDAGTDAGVDAGPDAGFSWDGGCLVLGDPAADPVIELVGLDNSQQMIPLQAGGPIPLFAAPQGGYVLMAGVRARNIQICGAQVTGSFKDPCSGRVLGLDGRTVDLAPTAAGDAAEPFGQAFALLSRFANIPACPSAAASRDVDHNRYDLTVHLQDARGKSAETTFSITPDCATAPDPAQCQCYCTAGYQLGQPCNGRDGGRTDGC